MIDINYLDKLIIKARGNIRNQTEKLFMGFVDNNGDNYEVQLQTTKNGKYNRTLRKVCTDHEEIEEFINRMTEMYPPEEDILIFHMCYV